MRYLKIKIFFSLVLFIGFILTPPGFVFSDEVRQGYITFLRETIKDSFKAIQEMVDKKTNLPYDIVKSKDLMVVDSKVSPTEIGEWMVSVLIARDQGLISKYEAQTKMIKILDTLERLPKHRGFLFQWYDAKSAKAISDFIPSIDNLNFDAAGIVVASAFRESSPIIYKRLRKLLDRKDYGFFYKKANKNLHWLNHGYDREKSRYSPYDYGHFLTEIGLSIMPIMKNEVPEETLTTTQVPVREYKLNNKSSSIVGLSWDGSLFNSLFPYLFVGYDILPEPIKKNLRKHVIAHINYAEKLNLPFWGWSPAWGSRGDEYVAWGVPELADWGGGYGVKNEILSKGYNPQFPEVTPYSSFLVLGVFNPEEEIFKDAIYNLRAMKKSGYGYNEFGFYDSINLEQKRGSKYKVSLDEGMNIIGAYNALRRLRGKPGLEGYFWNYFEFKQKEMAKRLLNQISDRKFLKLVSKKVSLPSVNEKLNPNKLISIDTHSKERGGWGFGLASCVSKDTYLEDEGMVWHLRYNIRKDFGGGYIKLYNLKPLQRYDYLILKVKRDFNDNTQGFQVELKEPGVVFPPVLKYPITDIPSDKWKRYVIPVETNVSESKKDIKPSELTIVFDYATTGTTQGSIYISDIWFYKK